MHKVILVFKKEQDLHDRKRHDEQDQFSEITKAILGCCFDVINTLGSGFVESVDRNALVIALNDSGLEVSAERGFEVVFRGRKIGIFVSDLIVEVTNLSVGLLVNFGKRKLEYRRAHHPAHHAACDHANPVPF